MLTSPGHAQVFPEAPGTPTSAIETTGMWLSQNDKKAGPFSNLTGSRAARSTVDRE